MSINITEVLKKKFNAKGHTIAEVLSNAGGGKGHNIGEVFIAGNFTANANTETSESDNNQEEQTTPAG